MKKAILIVGMLILALQVSVSAREVSWEDISRGNSDIRTILPNPDNPAIIYAGTGRVVLKTQDGGASWLVVLSVSGQNKAVNFLAFALEDKNSLFAATGNGLFYSSNQGQNWKRIFRGKNALESECTSVAVLSGTIYLGTRQGFWISKDKGKSWHRGSSELGNSHILSIAAAEKGPGYLYVACTEGVFQTKDNGQNWERIFMSSPTDAEEESEDTIRDDADETEETSSIRYLAVDPQDCNQLYLATAKGIYKSQDKGKNWSLLSDYGLLSQDIRFLLTSDQSRLCVATKAGIFEYRNERWYELSLGLTAEEINSLALDSQSNLYAACHNGLFKAKLDEFIPAQGNICSAYYQDEPEIKAVHKAAIKYAEVEPEKIIRWRKQAAKRAWLPKLTVDMDRDLDRTTSSSIWGTYSSNGTPGRYYVGPDDTTKYNNKNFGLSLTWELGDLIWSDDQTSIDVRSRLMVQLREDILDEVTKIYFERIRVKMDLNNLSIEDRKKRYEKELRLEELTATLDAITGGYFSQEIKNPSKSPNK